MKKKMGMAIVTTAVLGMALVLPTAALAAPGNGSGHHARLGSCVAAQMQRFVDADGDGVCDLRGTGQGNGAGTGFVDADGDGVCDNATGRGSAAGTAGAAGTGAHHGAGHRAMR